MDICRIIAAPDRSIYLPIIVQHICCASLSPRHCDWQSPQPHKASPHVPSTIVGLEILANRN